jgi:hypothetical protein
MGKCQATKSNGDSCNGNAGEGKFCAYHRKKYSGSIKHGKFASKELLGVPKKYDGIYQDFLQDDKPFDLRREMALLRILYIEARELLDNANSDKSTLIEEEVLKKLSHIFKGSEEKVKPILDVVSQTLKSVLSNELPSENLTLSDIDAISKLLETISRVAERMKKIQEGVKLQVSIDTNILVKFLQKVVFPEVVEPDRRNRMIMRASRLGLSRNNEIEDALYDVDGFDSTSKEMESVGPRYGDNAEENSSSSGLLLPNISPLEF